MTQEDWRTQLRERGYRLTPQRELILAAVERLGHATPDEVLAAVREQSSAVNVSTVQLRHARFVNEVSDLVEAGGAAGRHIDLEITESMIMADIASSMEKLSAIRALGVGAVISGHFSGWNLGIASGGFGGLAVAAGVVALMYLGLVYSLAEMSPALPHTGGAYSFARSAMGPWGGFVTGVAENIEYVPTPAVVVFFIGSYLGAILETGPEIQPLYWILGYATFVGANLFGVELSFRVTVFVTLVATLVAVASPPPVPPAPEFAVLEPAAAASSRLRVTLPPQAPTSSASITDLPTRTSAVAFIAFCMLPFNP